MSKRVKVNAKLESITGKNGDVKLQFKVQPEYVEKGSELFDLSGRICNLTIDEDQQDIYDMIEEE